MTYNQNVLQRTNQKIELLKEGNINLEFIITDKGLNDAQEIISTYEPLTKNLTIIVDKATSETYPQELIQSKVFEALENNQFIVFEGKRIFILTPNKN